MNAATIPPAALQVLTNPTLFSLASSFQHGAPLWVVDYERTFSHHGASLSRNDQAKQSLGETGLLPRLAIQNFDLDTLEKLVELSTCEYCQAHAKFSFAVAIDDAAKLGSIEMLQWLRDIAGAEYQRGTIATVAHLGHADVIRWLMANFPDCHAEITATLMDTAAQHGHLDVVQILHEWSTEGCTTQAMDGAAANGHLDVVVFLHEHRVEGCTTAAIDQAAQNGHLHVIEWLLLLRDEGFTQDASFGAVMNGHLEVLQCMWENRHSHDDSALRAGISQAVPQVLPTMPFAMAVFLFEIVPEAFPINSLVIASSAGRDDIAEYLRTVGTFCEGVDASLVTAAAQQAPESAQSLLDQQVFSVDVLQAALDASISVHSPDAASTSASLDPAVFALQIRLQQLIDQQTPIASGFLPLKAATTSPPASRRHSPKHRSAQKP